MHNESQSCIVNGAHHIDGRADSGTYRRAQRDPGGLCSGRTMAERNRHWYRDYEVGCDSDNKFQIKLRQLCAYPLDFSAILLYQLPGLHSWFRLRRYNGQHPSIHTNVLENEKIPGSHCHVHKATERYQNAGLNPDAFAVLDNRYWDLESAILCLLDDCGFRSLAESPIFTGRME
jgi:hypothetical protein